jgi:F-type H+-transporting ATPase subunit gamma
MPSLRDVKKKIDGVKNTQQITRAMKMVATARLRRTLDRLKSADRYLQKLEQMVADLNDFVKGEAREHPLFHVRPFVNRIGIILVSGERGLCGSFNTELFKATLAFMDEHPDAKKHLFIIGKKGVEFFRRCGIKPFASIPSLASPFDVKRVERVGQNAVRWYDPDNKHPEHRVDELYIVYARFISALQRQIRIKRVLPIENITGNKASRQPREMIFDPSPQEILISLIPRFVTGVISRAVLESSASEQSARMIAMGSATDRAHDMIKDMTLTYNRTRQALITKELAEVMGGAEALSD